jgi:DNA-directed RNA polymerase subunit RPC12/RpoP
MQTFDMVFICKKCKKAFRKDAREMEDADEFCPHCDNHFVLTAVEPKARLEVEGEDARIDARYASEIQRIDHSILNLCRMIKDERVQQEDLRTIFDVKDAPYRLG